MELASPAGNAQKLFYAWTYGADSAYIGLKNFSLRMKADNFDGSEYSAVAELKKKYPAKKLYCALNISFQNADIDAFVSHVEEIAQFPFDAFIVQDLGVVPLVQKYFPAAELHLSTQANCLNREAVKLYKSLGFSRVVLGRETSLADIRNIKDAVPDMELEAFAHGAMCISYSGRCLLSAYFTQRSANAGNCSQTCRWDFRTLTSAAHTGGLYLEEKERPGEYLPVFEGEGFTAILSAKDLCMIDNLADMENAGIDCIKLEGRMKSVYYTAVVTRAYRKALDALEHKITPEAAAPFTAELYNTPHRKFTTAFYYDPRNADEPAPGKTESEFLVMGTISAVTDEPATAGLLQKNPSLTLLCDELTQSGNPEPGSPATEAPTAQMYVFESMNKMISGALLEAVGPDFAYKPISRYALVHPETADILETVSYGHPCLMVTAEKLEPGYIVRSRTGTPDTPPHNAENAAALPDGRRICAAEQPAGCVQ